ncbi:MAG: NADPH-dependent FMN reductase [Jatrophihabitans sp.]|uniref:NADPH-dependent FMN reductase n=1 Tax=Jatrophihabitans sp. TaxID=1932789 RepID=UPI003F7CD509
MRMAPVIVGLGGSTSAVSVTGLALDRCLALAAEGGAEVRAFDGPFLAGLPIFSVDATPSAAAVELAEAVRGADALVVATPGYHGGMSGLVKNALDHLELLRDDRRPYLDGRAVGIVVTSSGWQACGTTLVAARSAVHALRGWPTPLGVMINSAEQYPDASGRFDARAEGALTVMTQQLLDFAGWQAAARAAVS